MEQNYSWNSDGSTITVLRHSEEESQRIFEGHRNDARSLWIALTYLARLGFPWPAEGHIGNRLKYDKHDYPDGTPFYHSLEEYEELVPENQYDTAWVGRGDWLYILSGGPDAIRSRYADVPWNLMKREPMPPCSFRIRRTYQEPLYNVLDEHVTGLFRPTRPEAAQDG